MRVGILLFATLLWIGTPVAGAIMVHTDQASFLAALDPGFYLETFDTTATGSTPAPLLFSASGFSYNVDLVAPAFSGLFPFTIPGGDPSDIIMASNDARDTIIFDFTSGNVTAAGGFFFSADLAGDATDADVIIDTDQTDPMALSTGGSTTIFLGFTSDTPLDFLTIIGDSTNIVAFASANDFIVGSAVPEPSAAILALTALASLSHRARSRSQGEARP